MTRTVDSDECEIGMNKFGTGRRCHGFAYEVLEEVTPSLDSDNRIDFTTPGSAPGNSGGRKPVTKIPRGEGSVGAKAGELR